MLDRQTGSFTIDLIYNSGGNKKKLTGDRQILSIKLESNLLQHFRIKRIEILDELKIVFTFLLLEF